MIAELERQAWIKAGKAKARAFLKESMDFQKEIDAPPLAIKAIDYAIGALAYGAPEGREKTSAISINKSVDWEVGLEEARGEVIDLLGERFR